MIALTLKFDGGLKTYQRGIDKEISALRSFRTLFEAFVSYLEGNGGNLTTMSHRYKEKAPSPILEIWKSKGAKIGANWKNTGMYEYWKRHNWEAYRVFNVPFGNTEQVLTGQTLSALLNEGTKGAVREIDDRLMVYGVENEYTKGWQDTRRVIDFYDDMIRMMDRITGAWLYHNAPELEIEED